MHKYSIILVLNIINLAAGVVVFLLLPSALFTNYFEIGLIGYIILSSSYFGRFGFFLVRPLRSSIFSLAVHRRSAMILIFPFIIYFSLFGSIGFAGALFAIMTLLLWIVAPHELIFRKKLSVNHEIKHEAIRQLIVLIGKIIVFAFPSEFTIALTIFLNTLASFAIVLKIMGKKFIFYIIKRIVKIGFFHLKKEFIFGSLFSYIVFLIMKFDYLYASYYNYSTLSVIAIGHKVEELILLAMTSFSPWFHRKITNENFSYRDVHIFGGLFFILLVFSYQVAVIVSDHHGLSLFFQGRSVSLILDNNLIVVSFIFTSVVCFCADSIYTKLISLSGVDQLVILKFVFAILIAYIASILVFATILNVSFFWLRVAPIFMLYLLYIFLLRRSYI